ncbi:hypothetical protein [Lacrimispora brassicae]
MKPWIGILAVCLLLGGCKALPNPVSDLTPSQAKIAGTVITMGKTTAADLMDAGFEVLQVDKNRVLDVFPANRLEVAFAYPTETYYIRMEKKGILIYIGIRSDFVNMKDTLPVTEIPFYDLQWLTRAENTPEDATIQAGPYTIRKGMTQEEIVALLGEGEESSLGVLYRFKEEGLEHEVLYNDDDILLDYILCCHIKSPK